MISNNLKEILETARLLSKNLGWLAIACAGDALFFIIYGFITRPLREKIVAGITMAGVKLAQLSQEAIETSYLKLLLHENVKPFVLNTLSILIILGLTTFLLYCFFHGTNWWVARTMAGKKESYHSYLLIFTKLNILWAAIFTAYLVIDTYFDLKGAMVQAITKQPSSRVLPPVLLIPIAYLALISYSKASLRGILKTGKNLKLTLPPMLACAAMLTAIHFIIKLAGMLSPTTAIIVGLATALPALTFTRTHLTRTLD